MAKTKIEMISRIIEILDLTGGSFPPLTELQIRNRLQSRLQNLQNKRLAGILGNLNEDLICQQYAPGKGYCKEDSLPKKHYCALHERDLSGEEEY